MSAIARFHSAEMIKEKAHMNLISLHLWNVQRELEGIFNKYGKITRLDLKTGKVEWWFLSLALPLISVSLLDFGFIEFEDKRDAEEAMNQVNGKVNKSNDR